MILGGEDEDLFDGQVFSVEHSQKLNQVFQTLGEP
jgi:hypothetical protein